MSDRPEQLDNEPDEVDLAPPRVRIDAAVSPNETRKPRLPSRETLVTLAIDVYKLALDHQTEVRKAGEVVATRADPDFKAATAALHLASDICAYTGSAAKAGAAQRVEEEEIADAEAALEALRSKIAKTET